MKGAPLNGMPGWAKAIAFVGLPGFIALYLLGVFDGVLPSPVTAAIRRHDEGTLRVLRTICVGIWRDNPSMQKECDR